MFSLLSAHIVFVQRLSGVTMACTRLSAEWSAQGEREQYASWCIEPHVLFVLFPVCGTILLGFGIGSAPSCLRRAYGCHTHYAGIILLTGVENILKSTMIGMNRVMPPRQVTAEQIVRIGATMRCCL
ncbi:MAG: hypothetical protein ACLUB2_03070 [Butyricicoccus pullicaecorum]